MRNRVRERFPIAAEGGRWNQLVKWFVVCGNRSRKNPARIRNPPHEWMYHPGTQPDRVTAWVARRNCRRGRGLLRENLVGDVMGRVITAPVHKGQAVFMRVSGESFQNLLFCQTRQPGVVALTMVHCLQAEGGVYPVSPVAELVRVSHERRNSDEFRYDRDECTCRLPRYLWRDLGGCRVSGRQPIRAISPGSVSTLE